MVRQQVVTVFGVIAQKHKQIVDSIEEEIPGVLDSISQIGLLAHGEFFNWWMHSDASDSAEKFGNQIAKQHMLAVGVSRSLDDTITAISSHYQGRNAENDVWQQTLASFFKKNGISPDEAILGSAIVRTELHQQMLEAAKRRDGDQRDSIGQAINTLNWLDGTLYQMSLNPNRFPVLKPDPVVPEKGFWGSLFAR